MSEDSGVTGSCRESGEGKNMSGSVTSTTPVWMPHKIGGILILEYGKALKDYQDGDGKYPVFGTNGKIGATDNYLYDKPSIVIGRKGAYRGVHYADRPFSVIDTAFYTKNKTEDLSTEFLYHWFKCVDINSMDSGSAIPSTSRDEVYDLDHYCPEMRSYAQDNSLNINY